MLPSARHYRLKAAQQELVALCGGIVRAADICGYSKTVVGRWADEDSTELMNPIAVDKLESAVGKKVWTVAWVESRGLKLSTEDDAEARLACLTTEMAGLVGDFGAVMAEWAATAADGRATPTEAMRVRRTLAELKERISSIESGLAGVMAEGGISLVAGGRT